MCVTPRLKRDNALGLRRHPSLGRLPSLRQSTGPTTRTVASPTAATSSSMPVTTARTSRDSATSSLASGSVISQSSAAADPGLSAHPHTCDAASTREGSSKGRRRPPSATRLTGVAPIVWVLVAGRGVSLAPLIEQPPRALCLVYICRVCAAAIYRPSFWLSQCVIAAVANGVHSIRSIIVAIRRARSPVGSVGLRRGHDDGMAQGVRCKGAWGCGRNPAPPGARVKQTTRITGGTESHDAR